MARKLFGRRTFRRGAAGLALAAPASLAGLRWRAMDWGADSEEEPSAELPPVPLQRWDQLRNFAERAALFQGSGHPDVAKIRQWHLDRGFAGAITLRERDAPGEEGGVVPWPAHSSDRSECYYVYYELTGRGRRVQHVFIRGSCKPEDVFENLMFAKDWDEELGCQLHHGFRRRAGQILESLEALLDPQAEITLSGHSLGGAVATIVGMRLLERGYNVQEVVTFGAPKVTDRAGAQSSAIGERVLRVTNTLDPVPLLPFGFCTPFSGPFTHLGAQLLLLPGDRPGAYCYLGSRAASSPWVGSFLLHAQAPHHLGGLPAWLRYHRMPSYRLLMAPMAADPRAGQRVRFSQRHRSRRDRLFWAAGGDAVLDSPGEAVPSPAD